MCEVFIYVMFINVHKILRLNYKYIIIKKYNSYEKINLNLECLGKGIM